MARLQLLQQYRGTQGNIPVNIVVSNAMVLQTFLVTGGWDSNEDVLASTELLAEGSASWVRTGELPTPRSGLTGAHIDGRILMAGNKKIYNAQQGRGKSVHTCDSKGIPRWSMLKVQLVTYTILEITDISQRIDLNSLHFQMFRWI